MVKIEIVPDLKQHMKDTWKYVRDVAAGKVEPKSAVRTLVFTPETFSSTFSPERVRLILVLRKWEGNIYQLAKYLGRSYEAVHRDIAYLEGMKLIKVRTKDRKKFPYIDEPIRIPAFA